MSRPYQVLTAHHPIGRELKAFIVTDCTIEEQQDRKQRRPQVAEFPVSVLHDAKTQQARAFDLCDLLNRATATAAGAQEE